MNEENNKNLGFVLDEVDDCNNYFRNHVGKHKEERVRKGLIILQVIAIIVILIWIL